MRTYLTTLTVCLSLSAASPSKGRVVHFPKDLSIGRVYLVEMPLPQDCLWHKVLTWDNKNLGEARGDVAVPGDGMTRLDVFGEVLKADRF